MRYLINLFSSKKRIYWKFKLDGKIHDVELFVSKMSGKKRVVKDGYIVTQIKE